MDVLLNTLKMIMFTKLKKAEKNIIKCEACDKEFDEIYDLINHYIKTG